MKGSDLREEKCLLVFLEPRSVFVPSGTVPPPSVLKDQFLKLQRVGAPLCFPSRCAGLSSQWLAVEEQGAPGAQASVAAAGGLRTRARLRSCGAQA